jgi:hypothetical protein
VQYYLFFVFDPFFATFFAGVLTGTGLGLG